MFNRKTTVNVHIKRAARRELFGAVFFSIVQVASKMVLAVKIRYTGRKSWLSRVEIQKCFLPEL